MNINEIKNLGLSTNKAKTIKEISNLFNVKFQTTLLIFKNNKEIYRSLGETTEDLIYEALKKVI